MLCPFSLHLSALFRFMASYDAARRGSKQSVMDGVMTGDASYESTLKAALCIGPASLPSKPTQWPNI
jgi:hypothetical protein